LLYYKLMEGDKVEVFEVHSAEEMQQFQAVLANYEFKAGKRVAFQSNGSQAKFIIPLADFVRCRDRNMAYSSVDYEGEKDLFRIEMKCNKK
jgi:ABC-type phosphate/phosphonate transport system substrate-binding protein